MSDNQFAFITVTIFPGKGITGFCGKVAMPILGTKSDS
jgi:hypothetical protein